MDVIAGIKKNDFVVVGRVGMDLFPDPPGMDIENDAAIDAWVKANVESAYHPSCSVKMGADDDPMAVLDGECRVRGTTGLRVADSSIFPSITNGNLNAPSMMVGERAADLIRGQSLPAEHHPVWEPDNWQNKQRSVTGHDREN